MNTIFRAETAAKFAASQYSRIPFIDNGNDIILTTITRNAVKLADLLIDKLQNTEKATDLTNPPE